MDPELINAWAAVLNAVVWPITILVILVIGTRRLWPLIVKGAGVRLKLKDVAEISIEPTKGLRPPSAKEPEDEESELKMNVQEPCQEVQSSLPPDYYYLNHTSFLRRDKQDEFRRRTGIPLDHYDIRVIVDSYYEGALDRIEQVEYILHRAYPQPFQYRTNRSEKFLLKELANGEYVLMAKVYLKDRKDQVVLQRYINLLEAGPRLL